MYKVQRGLELLLLILITLTFYGCSSSNQKNNAENKIHTALKTLKSYETDAEITFLKDTQDNTIRMKQEAEIEGRYKLTIEDPAYLKGYTTTFDGKEIYQYNPHTKTSIQCKANEARNQILISTFIYQYLNTQDVKTEKSALNGKEFITFEIPIPGNYKYMATEKVWFDEEKLSPVKMIIYDTEGKVTIQVLFEHFKYNPKLNF